MLERFSARISPTGNKQMAKCKMAQWKTTGEVYFLLTEFAMSLWSWPAARTHPGWLSCFRICPAHGNPACRRGTWVGAVSGGQAWKGPAFLLIYTFFFLTALLLYASRCLVSCASSLDPLSSCVWMQEWCFGLAIPPSIHPSPRLTSPFFAHVKIALVSRSAPLEHPLVPCVLFVCALVLLHPQIPMWYSHPCWGLVR